MVSVLLLFRQNLFSHCFVLRSKKIVPALFASETSLDVGREIVVTGPGEASGSSRLGVGGG